MIQYLKKQYKKAQFQPTLLALFTNPYFIIRRGLHNGIKLYAPELKGRLLDFGCGSKPYKQLFQVDEYIGTDVEMSGHSHENEDIDVYYSGDQLPFEDNTFDSVLSSEVFEHLFNLETMLKELNRVMKQDGKILITVPFVWDEHEIPYDFGRYSSFGIQHLLQKHGFKILNSHKSTSYYATIVQMKNAYIYQHIFPKNKFLKILLTPIFIAPATIWGLFWGVILSKHKGFFHNNIILAQKVHS